MTTSEKVTAVIAVYGAVLSTITVARQLVTERARIKITVSRDMMVHGDPRYEGMTLIILKVINIGRRPVTITHTGAWCLYPKNPFMCTDSQPPLAHEIQEGEAITSILDQGTVDTEAIDYWQAIDSAGKIYKLRAATRIEHWKSRVQWRLAKTNSS